MELKEDRNSGLALAEDGNGIKPHISMSSWRRHRAAYPKPGSCLICGALTHSLRKCPRRQCARRFEARDSAREVNLKKQRLEKSVENDENAAKVDDSRLMNFAKGEKHVPKAGGESIRTVMDLHIGEDTTEYSLDHGINSANYDLEPWYMHQ